MENKADALCEFAYYWRLDGDLMYCLGCGRALHVSRDGEELRHGAGCELDGMGARHPWTELRRLIATPTDGAPNETRGE